MSAKDLRKHLGSLKLSKGEQAKLRRFDQLCKRISDALADAGVTRAQLLRTLPEIREELYREHYK